MSLEVSYGIIPFRRLKRSIEILLIQHHAGHWSFPKGGAEPSEHPIDAAQRELREETGLEIKRLIIPEDTLCEHYFFNRGNDKVQKRVEYFIAEVEGELDIQIEEIRDSIWLSPEKIEDQATFPESKRICRRVIDLLMQL
ncbi:Bis(5'-nucleosyl)-tetraphosphatase [asymmetrical] [Waddlia chondrophila 2032/99]|uniref:Bis(5'-nucleosyl)-tetraphosphatase [asymmetrical] n=2 Tax=Waddlia chondrophila TaxID=71667 RepID=D6YRM9_WADCW|nr:NUDIX domain-containing protein [Waddlia chondrophila]ADI38724.1 putative pyrophosphohydrolase [Waddlia chondrophila WSU 86-1044]CCB92261.1 Bis(5'-nucleosyl)-tetraphosphatase [asymmetrical] [Waddlia chondrophila 2032/99]